VAKVMLTGDTRVARVRDVVNGEGLHWSVPLSFILIRVYHDVPGLSTPNLKL
jgi:hypothetical protein